jgi:hypothetical protein
MQTRWRKTKMNKKKFIFANLNDWISAIVDVGPHEELIDHIKRHATQHISHEPFNDWVDSMINMLVMYNLKNNRCNESKDNRMLLLEKYRKKHNSNI